MKKFLIFAVGGAVFLSGVVLLPLFLLAALMGEANDVCTGGGEGGVDSVPVNYAGPGKAGLNALQTKRAAAIVAQGRRMKIPDRGIIVALATASQESGFKVYANDGSGGDLGGDQHGIERSLSLPHDAVGTDHGSLGLFQQQWPWWGSMEELMDPATSAAKFYQALQKIPHWQSLPVTVAAQRVQRSAYPDAYADDEAVAIKLLEMLSGEQGAAGSPVSVGTAAAADPTGQGIFPAAADGLDCSKIVPAAAVGGTIVYPLAKSSGYQDQRNWGGRGSHWGSWHTGTDLSVRCGTPVLAVHAGKVIIRTDQSWAGNWLVEISTGPTSLTTWYAHMRAINVHDGDTVTPGQQIGEVGDLGNSSGCHLHFEVHKKNGTIYGPDNVNPTPWLASHVGRSLPVLPVVSAGSSASDSSGGFRLVTLNILGSSHTSRRGSQHPTWGTGRARVPGMVATLSRWGTDVAALQEVQPSQRRAITAVSARQYAMFPAARVIGDNRLLWRTSTFEKVGATTFKIPYFNGHMTSMPAVLLRQRSTGKVAWFASVHNPAETGDYHHQGRFRARAVAAERRFVLTKVRTGAPVFLMGDLNAKTEAFCPLAAGNRLRSASGGSGAPKCRPPAHQQIDWIFAAGGARFSGYQVDRTPARRHISDHPIVISQAHIR